MRLVDWSVGKEKAADPRADNRVAIGCVVRARWKGRWPTRAGKGYSHHFYYPMEMSNGFVSQSKFFASAT